MSHRPLKATVEAFIASNKIIKCTFAACLSDYDKGIFLSLAKRHFNSGVISQSKTEDSSFVSTDKEILSECEHFIRTFIVPIAKHVDYLVN